MGLVELLLPPECHLCGVSIPTGMLCTACVGELPAHPGNGCPVCALPTGQGGVCGRCQRHPPAFDRSVTPYLYDFPLSHLIHGLKYGHRLQFGRFLAERVLAAVAVQGAERPDLIVPMPLHPDRLRERGFNQAAEIARPLARHAGCRMDPGILVRDVATPPQVGLPWRARAANVRGAFRCTADLDGLRVAVVDDVMTTGATLHEAARTLKSRGAVWVENWVVARTP